MKKKIIIAAAAAVVLAVAAFFIIRAVTRPAQQRVEVDFQTDNSVYQLSDEDVSHDEESGIDYVNNIVIIFFENNVPGSEAEAIIADTYRQNFQMAAARSIYARRAMISTAQYAMTATVVLLPGAGMATVF